MHGPDPRSSSEQYVLDRGSDPGEFPDSDSEAFLALVAANATDVIGVARHGVITWMSPSFTTQFGWTRDDWLGRDLSHFVNADDIDVATGDLDGLSAGRMDPVIRRARMRASDGAEHWVDVHAGPYRDARGKADGVIAVIRIVDDAVEVEAELELRATTDELTGLVNRREILARLDAATTDARRPGELKALLYCDVDGFKEVNDLHGHAAGDAVLATIAERLRTAVRHGDVVARVGGDELLILLTGIHDVDEALSIAEKVRQVASAPVELEEGVAIASTSIGATLVRPGEPTDALIARADWAMYTAKQAGGNRVTFVP